MELQQNLEKIRQQGLGVAAISYDSPATLKNFAERRGIGYPLLSDAGSAIIRAFGILNTEVPQGTPFAGIPYPGTYIVDPTGKVIAKYFEDDYTQRYMTSDILVRQFGATAGGAHATVETRHLSLSSAASADRVRPGQRIALTLDIELKPSMHVYAPGVEGYIPIEWTMEAGSQSSAHAVEFPAPKRLRLEAIQETVPVFSGKFRLVRDVTIGKLPPGPLTISGALRYQACDDRQCYIPQTVPLKWTVNVEPHDRERPPEELRRKSR
ncbi:MAG: redoxin domain-containing protein [Acidobacteria bacterium]|nr:redoxin domain-containing protein [Acidobacteriota bacterium]